MARSLDPVEAAGPATSELRPAAVLALIDPRVDQLPLLLLKRHRAMHSHPGQVALPGGGHASGDGPLWRTALREAREELGVPASAVVLLGSASPVPVRHSGYLITPVVGLLQRAFVPRMDPSEVEDFFWFPLRDRAHLVSPSRQPVDGQEGPATWPGYLFLGHFVWGATGRIVDDLRRRLGEPVAGA